MKPTTLPELVTTGTIALAMTFYPIVSEAQVPVNDHTREQNQLETQDRYQNYQMDMRAAKGASGGTTDSVAPGMGSGLSTDCSLAGFTNETAPAGKPHRTHSQQEIARMVKDEAIRQGVDPYFALAIAEQESRFRQSARSGVGAIGVMQLMPQTAEGLGVDPYDTRDNIRGGVTYIKKLQGMFGNRYHLIAAGYNAGPYRQSLQNGQIPNIPETQNYVKKVSAYYSRNRTQNGDRIPADTADLADASGGRGCGEQLKVALDRNTEAQIERAQAWNMFVQKSNEVNQQYLQRLQSGLRSSSAGLRGSGGGGTADRSSALIMAQVQCPPSIVDTGSTRCFAVPSNATTGQIQHWLQEIQQQVRANGDVATFSAMEDAALGLVTVVETGQPQN